MLINGNLQGANRGDGVGDPTIIAASGEWINLVSFTHVLGADGDWTNTEKAIVEDDTYAQSIAVGTGATDILKCLDLSKKIPTGVTVNGIQVRIQKYSSASTDAKDKTIQLYKAGSLQGDNNADLVTIWDNPNDLDNYFTYGGVADLWALTLTAADVNAANFGVGIAVTSTDFKLMQIDHVQIAVTY